MPFICGGVEYYDNEPHSSNRCLGYDPISGKTLGRWTISRQDFDVNGPLSDSWATSGFLTESRYGASAGYVQDFGLFMAGGQRLTEEWFEYTASVEASRDGIVSESLPELPVDFGDACLVALGGDRAMVTGGNYEAGTPFNHTFVYGRGDAEWTRYAYAEQFASTS